MHIGNVSGGIHSSIVAGGSVRDVSIGLGVGTPLESKAPTVDELQRLLARIQQGLADAVAQQSALKQVSPAVPYAVLGAEASIKDARARVRDDPQSVQQILAQAASLIEGTVQAAQMGGGRSVAGSLAEVLQSLLEEIGVAAAWAAQM